MAYFISLVGFTPGARYNATPWVSARIEEASAASGPWTVLETVALAPVDADPTAPQARNFSTSLAVADRDWFRVTFVDGTGATQSSEAVYATAVSYGSQGRSLSVLRGRVKRYGFAVPDDEIDATINDRYKEMVAGAEWLLTTLDLGMTVAGQRSYPLDQDVAVVKMLKVGTRTYEPMGLLGMASLEGGDQRGSRWFGESYTPDGRPQLDLHPTPGDEPLPLVLVAAMLPRDLVADSDVPVIPADFHDFLVDGACSTLSRRVDNRLADADALEQRFYGGTEKLKRRRKQRVQGGPAQLQVRGRHW